MAYTAQTDIQAYIKQTALIAMLDDTGSGMANPGLLDTIIAQVSLEIDGYVQSIYAVPFSNPPSAIQAAACILTCEALYKRRLPPDVANPFDSQAKQIRDNLKKIGSGELNLSGVQPRIFSQGTGILSFAKVNNDSLGI